MLRLTVALLLLSLHLGCANESDDTSGVKSEESSSPSTEVLTREQETEKDLVSLIKKYRLPLRIDTEDYEGYAAALTEQEKGDLIKRVIYLQDEFIQSKDSILISIDKISTDIMNDLFSASDYYFVVGLYDVKNNKVIELKKTREVEVSASLDKETVVEYTDLNITLTGTEVFEAFIENLKDVNIENIDLVIIFKEADLFSSFFNGDELDRDAISFSKLMPKNGETTKTQMITLSQLFGSDSSTTGEYNVSNFGTANLTITYKAE